MAVSAKSETKGPAKRRRLLRLSGLAVLLVGAYAAAGFALLPWLVKSKLPEISEREFKHRVTAGEVRFNPFKLLLEVSDLRLAEPGGAPMIGLAALTVDFAWSSLMQRTWRFALVRFAEPQLNLAIAADGRFNLAELIAAFNQRPPVEKQALPRLLIERFELRQGRVDFTDRRAGYSNRITPIDFAVDNLSTLPDQNGPYTFSANTARGGSIRWQGQASLNPIGGRGQLVLDSISLPELASYAKPWVELSMTAGKLGASLPYRFAYTDGKLAFDVEGASLKLAELGLRIGDATAPSVTLPSLGVDNINASLGKGELAVAAIRLTDLGIGWPGAGKPSLAIPALTIESISGSRGTGELGIVSIRATRLAVNLQETGTPALSLAALVIAGISARRDSAELSVASITLADGRLEARRDARGLIDWLALLPADAATPSVAPRIATTIAAAPTAAAAGATPAAAPAPWKLAVGQVRFDNFALAYTDLTARTPLEVSLAKVGVKLAFAASQTSQGLTLGVTGAELAVKDMLIGGKNEGPVRVAELGVTGAALTLAPAAAPGLMVDRAWLKGAQLKLALDAAGKPNLLALLPRPAAATAGPIPAVNPTSVNAKAGESLRYAVKLVEVTGVSADFEDQASGVKVRATDAGLRLTGLSSDWAKPVGFETALKLREGGDLRAKGNLVPATAALDAAVKIERLALAPAQPLLARMVKLDVASGSVDVDGRLAIGGKGAQLRYSGAAGLSDLLLNEVGGKQFAALKSALAEGINFTLVPNALEIPELRLDAPQAQLLIEADRTLNAQRLLVQQLVASAGGAVPATVPAAAAAGASPATVNIASAPAVSPPPAAALSSAAAEAFPVAVRRLRINNAKLDFEDLSLRPQFAARIQDLSGVITGLSTNPATRSKLELDGRVDEFGSARIRGEFNPFFPRVSTDVNLVFKNVDMTSATPYAMKFAGYRIAAGKISLDLNYKVRNSQLEGDNQVVLDQLTLGERVDSPDAIKLPLELALAILKDSDGRIDLGLPVSGSLDDPQFSYGAIVWKALINVIGRIVTAPFRALGSLFGGDGAKLEAIDFDAGSARLLPPERQKLRQVAQVLAKRAQLKLAIPGQFNEAADAPVLRDRAMRSEILRRAGLKIVAGEEPGPLDMQDRAQRVALRETLSARHGAPALALLLAEAERGVLSPPTVGSAPVAKRDETPIWRRALNLAQGEPNLADPAAFYSAIAVRLATSQPLAADALARLGTERSQAIAAALKEAGIDGSRIDLPAPEKTEAAGKVVPLKLGLAAR